MFGFLISSAHAQAAAPKTSFMSFIPLIAIGFIFYFMMIRPQKKRWKKEQEYLNTIQKGDEVYTKSGILGTIVGVTEKVVTLELDSGVKMKLLKGQIGGSSKAFLEPSAQK